MAEVNPGLVQFDQDGQPQTVLYHVLPTLLLNELQKRTVENQLQTSQIAKLSAQMAEVRADRDRERAERAALEGRVSAMAQTIAAQNRGPRLAAVFDR